MIDARIQIKELLETIDYDGLKVKMSFPKSINTVPLITFFEITNTGTSIKVVDSISFQIDVWGEDFETVIDLMLLADEKLTGLGFKRDYASQDSDSVDASGFYRKTLRYSSAVDTRTNRLINY